MLSLLSRLLDRWGLASPAPERAAWLSQWTYAHRGMHDGAVVENSPTAFAAAMAHGFAIECDVQRTADGAALVFHDWELDRLTMQSGPVDALTLAQLTRVRLRCGGDMIPSLEQVLAQIAGAVPLLIEIKSRGDRHVRPLCIAIRRALEGYGGDSAVMSFDPQAVAWFAAHAPQIVRGLVVTETGGGEAKGSLTRHLAMRQARPDFLACDIRDLPSRFAAAQRRRGIPVLTWTVRTAGQCETAALHADAAIAEAAGLK